MVNETGFWASFGVLFGRPKLFPVAVAAVAAAAAAAVVVAVRAAVGVAVGVVAVVVVGGVRVGVYVLFRVLLEGIVSTIFFSYMISMNYLSETAMPGGPPLKIPSTKS